MRNTYIAGVLGVVLLFSAAAPVYASSLTPSQVSAVVNLLQSFGVDSQTIVNVETALGASQIPPPAPCSGGLSYSFGVGATGSEVTSLQSALGISATGYYGALTKIAVTNWQSAHNVPATGYVGPLTRTAFAIWCGGSGIPPQSVSLNATPTSGAAPLTVAFSANDLNASDNYIIDYGDGSNSGSLQASPCTTANGCTISVSHIYSSTSIYTATLSPYIACMYTNPRCMIATQLLGSVVITVGDSQTALPTLYSISPTSGLVGSVATIAGFGFTSDNTILFSGNVAARDVPITSSIAIACTTDPSCHGGIQQTLTFTVPSSIAPNCPVGSMCPMYMQLVTPGQYSVSVQNATGTSNTSIFTVTSGTSQL